MSVPVFLSAVALGTLVEYVLHRYLLHSRLRHFITRRHKLHHKSNRADTLWGDFRDFLPGMLPFCWLGFLGGARSGAAFLAGAVFYVFLLALAHKLSHESPRVLFWMNPNVHALHHAGAPRWNYGITTSFWDRVFGTYRDTA